MLLFLLEIEYTGFTGVVIIILYMTISNQCNGCSETGEIVPFGIEVYIDDSLFYKNDAIDSFYVFPLRWVYIEYPIDSLQELNVLFESSPFGLM